MKFYARCIISKVNTYKHSNWSIDHYNLSKHFFKKRVTKDAERSRRKAPMKLSYFETH